MALYKRGDVWWLYIVHEGVRHRASTGEREKARAKRIHDEFAAELWRQRRGGGTLYGALEAWLGNREGPDAYRVKRLKELAQDRLLTEVTAEWLESLIPDSTPGTFNRYANLLTAAWNKARRKTDLPPLTIERKKAPASRVRWLTAEEWGRLRDALPDHQRPMADLAISTGLRQANVLRLEWSQVDLARGRLWIHADQAKGRKPIGIKLNDDALRVLEAQHKATGGGRWVFLGKDGKKPPTEIKAAWKRACRDAGIEDFRWHDLRHTWATWHIMAGTPKEALQKLGGWKDERMVQKYAHMAESFVDSYAGNAKPYSGHIPRHNAKKIA